jgi:RNA polymerase sigma factor (sigma-70 family)
MNQDPLAELAAAAVAGDRRALEPLCRALEGPIYRLALRMLGDAEDARDATQEILVRAITRLAQFRGESKLLTWVYTLATRHLLRARSRAERTRDVPTLATWIDAGLAATAPDAVPTGEAHAAVRETQLACTQAMLFALSREERIAILLADVLGADDATGAAVCEVSLEAYRKRLSRARATLHPLLAQRCGLADAAAPCRCPRQARAKELAGPVALRWAHLPVVDAARIEAATGELGRLHRMPAVFAFDPPIAPPAEGWQQIARALAHVLGAEIGDA